MHNPAENRVVIAMSGGVDSSVAAALLVQQGYDVVGVMMRLWSEPALDPSADGCADNRCCTPDQMRDARRIADKLGIPFYILDSQTTFQQTIVQQFIDSYTGGQTPNPCLSCNRHIRFTHLLDHALALDADFLATGHYVQLKREEDGNVRLYKGIDEKKDQSYVLSLVQQERLNKAMFPIGGYTKPEVRKLAAKYGLPVASKQDSQDLCFVADGDYKRFLRDHAPDAMQPGAIVTRQGQVLGKHVGLPAYTIGQRKGIGIGYPEPLYVIGKNSADNALIVGIKSELGSQSLTTNQVNWLIAPPSAPFTAEIKIRYKAVPVPGVITPCSDGRVSIEFDEPLLDIAVGQGAVFYQGDQCLGGGLIATSGI